MSPEENFRRLGFKYYNAGRKIGRTQDIFTGDGPR
jgi:hypothetical protein